MTYPVSEDTLLLESYLEDRDLDGKTVLEVGTGNGLVAVTAAGNGAEVTATDTREEAVEDARERAREAGVDVRFVESDLFEEVDGSFDMVLFNPPYLPGEDPAGEWGGGPTGVEVTMRFLEQVERYLEAGGEAIFVASSRSDLQSLAEGFRLEELESRELWFETLYLFRYAPR